MKDISMHVTENQAYILAWEDWDRCDALSQHQRSSSSDKKLSFSCILNEMDGICEA